METYLSTLIDPNLPQSKKANETDLRREFEMYGPIERIRIVRNRKGKSNGYAFIVYERERDMKGRPSTTVQTVCN